MISIVLKKKTTLKKRYSPLRFYVVDKSTHLMTSEDLILHVFVAPRMSQIFFFCYVEQLETTSAILKICSINDIDALVEDPI